MGLYIPTKEEWDEILDRLGYLEDKDISTFDNEEENHEEFPG